MVAWGLALTASLALAGAGVYTAVGLAVQRRSPARDVRAANTAFAGGWMLLGAMVATDALRVASGTVGPPSEALYLTLIELKIILTAAALAALGTYVLYVWSGRAWVWMPMAAAGLAHAFAFLALTLGSLPMSVDVGTWATRLEVEGTVALPGGRLTGIALFFGPFLALVLLYMLLWRRVGTRTQRYRLLAVGVSLLVFLGGAAVQSNPDVSPDTLTLPAVWIVILLAGIFSLWAFEPPAWLRRGLSIRPVEMEGQPALVEHEYAQRG